MIDALAKLVAAFPGAANWTRCFAHILNLVVKVILRQSDLPKAKGGGAADVATQALLDLAGDGGEIEEASMDTRDDGDEDDNDNKMTEKRGWSIHAMGCVTHGLAYLIFFYKV
jgi:hypothetical protein